MSSYSVADLLNGKEPVVAATYERLAEQFERLGARVDAKKTCLHIVNKTGFAGMHFRKSYLLLEISLDRGLLGERISKVEQVSKGRYHNTIKLGSPDEVDEEIAGWLEAAFRLHG